MKQVVAELHRQFATQLVARGVNAWHRTLTTYSGPHGRGAEIDSILRELIPKTSKQYTKFLNKDVNNHVDIGSFINQFKQGMVTIPMDRNETMHVTNYGITQITFDDIARGVFEHPIPRVNHDDRIQHTRLEFAFRSTADALEAMVHSTDIRVVTTEGANRIDDLYSKGHRDFRVHRLLLLPFMQKLHEYWLQAISRELPGYRPPPGFYDSVYGHRQPAEPDPNPLFLSLTLQHIDGGGCCVPPNDLGHLQHQLIDVLVSGITEFQNAETCSTDIMIPPLETVIGRTVWNRSPTIRDFRAPVYHDYPSRPRDLMRRPQYEDDLGYETEIVYEFEGGYTLKLLNIVDVIEEGRIMGHCVSGPGYQDRVLRGDCVILSLRDSANKPHLTIELLTKLNPLLSYRVTLPWSKVVKTVHGVNEVESRAGRFKPAKTKYAEMIYIALFQDRILGGLDVTNLRSRQMNSVVIESMKNLPKPKPKKPTLLKQVSEVFFDYG